MRIDEYIQYDGLGLAELVRYRQVTATELATCALTIIDRLNPEIGAVIETFEDTVASFATTSNSQAKFLGVPFLIKDLMLHKANIPVEMGSRLARDISFPYDSHLMSKYHNSGVITIGRTKTPEMGFNISTENIFQGAVRNPWNIDYSPGGSSGGAAAAVASGMVPLAHASDGGGSIRIPASCCGLFGLKPTRGRVPIGPNVGEALQGFAAEHIVSRTVRDSAAMLDISCGAGIGDPYIIPTPERPYLTEVQTVPRKLKIALATEAWGGEKISNDVDRVLKETVQLCRDLGHDVVETSPKLKVSWDEFLQTICYVWCAHIAHTVHLMADVNKITPSEENLEKTTLACYHYGQAMSAQDLLTAEDNCNMLCRNVAFFFQYYDILLTPTLPRAPQPLGTFNANADLGALEWVHKIFNASPFTPIFNITGQPAMSVPLGYGQNALPVGMQFAARYGAEADLFQLAGQLERARPWNYNGLKVTPERY